MDVRKFKSNVPPRMLGNVVSDFPLSVMPLVSTFRGVSASLPSNRSNLFGKFTIQLLINTT